MEVVQTRLHHSSQELLPSKPRQILAFAELRDIMIASLALHEERRGFFVSIKTATH
jgi:hypothetical protein